MNLLKHQRGSTVALVAAIVFMLQAVVSAWGAGVRIGSARPSDPRTRSVGRATSPTEADVRSYPTLKPQDMNRIKQDVL